MAIMSDNSPVPTNHGLKLKGPNESQRSCKSFFNGPDTHNKQKVIIKNNKRSSSGRKLSLMAVISYRVRIIIEKIDKKKTFP